MQDLKPGMLVLVTNTVLTEDNRIWQLLIVGEDPTHWVTRMVYNSAGDVKDHFRISKLYLENRIKSNQLKILSESH